MRGTTREAIAVHSLEAAARVALYVLPPLRAKRAVDAIARLLPRFRSPGRAMRGAASLGATGSCLSRSLAISAMLPGSEIVIGGRRAERDSFRAHAWVELNGQPLCDPGAVPFRTLARLTCRGDEKSFEPTTADLTLLRSLRRNG
jgi:hypothetical protein